MSLRIRRGTEAQRTGVVFDLGELVATTDTFKLYVGDGITAGGRDIAQSLAGDGLVYDAESRTLQWAGVNFTTDDVPQGTSPTRQYFTDLKAQQAAADLFINGTHTGISFVYDDQDAKINATVSTSLNLNALTDVVITGTPTNGQVLKYSTADGAWVAGADIDTDTGILSVSADTNPSLGGQLNLSGFGITGTGDIDINGDARFTGAITNDILTVSYSTIYSVDGHPGGTDRSDAPLYIGTDANPTTMWVTSDNNFGVFKGLTDGTNNAGFTFKISRGTLGSPLSVAAGDAIGFIDGTAFDGTSFVNVGAFGLFADPDGTVSTGVVPGAFGVVVLDALGAQQQLAFNSQGILSVPRVSVGNGTAGDPSIVFSTDGGLDSGFFHPGDGIVCTTINAVEKVRVDSGGMRVSGFMKVGGFATGSLPNPPEAGMIVLDTTTSQFKGWNGSAWVVLG